MSFIPKDIYPAVMFARQMMRGGESVGLAVYKAAKYYSVDQSKVAQWLNGKKQQKKQITQKMKFCWDIVWQSSDYSGVWVIDQKTIFQTNNRVNSGRKISRECLNRSRHNDTGSIYSLFYTHTIAPKLYTTKAEAEKELKKYISENLNDRGEKKQ